MVLKIGHLLLKKFSSKDLVSSVDKGISPFYLDGTIILILKSIVKSGPKSNNK